MCGKEASRIREVLPVVPAEFDLVMSDLQHKKLPISGWLGSIISNSMSRV
jgi:hypothetical protein